MVLNAVASMTGPSSGGKAKVLKHIVKEGFKKSAAKRSLKILEEEKAIFRSPSKRTLPNSTRTWSTLRADKNKLAAANMFKN